MFYDKTNDLIKAAAFGLLLKKADVGYTNGYLYEMGRHIDRNVPGIVKDTGSFVYNNATPLLLGTAALAGGIYGYNRYRKWKKDKEEKERKAAVPVVPLDVITKRDRSEIPAEVLATPSDGIPADVIKTSGYRMNKVVGWLYK